MGEVTHLSMIVMMGATRHAALNPAVKSDARRRPRCLVFHTRGSSTSFGGGRVRGCVGASFGAGISTRGVLELILCSFQLDSKFIIGRWKLSK